MSSKPIDDSVIAEAQGDWPDYLMIRDTGLQDDMGGLGQRIFTTAGAGYQKVKYVRADLAAQQQPEERGVVDVEAIRRACQSGKRFWQAGPGCYEEIEPLLPALTEALNGR